MIADLYEMTGGRIPLIGVGGIFTAQDAWEKITAGASLVQLYTGFIYQGLSIAQRDQRRTRHAFSRAKVSQTSMPPSVAAQKSLQDYRIDMIYNVNR